MDRAESKKSKVERRYALIVSCVVVGLMAATVAPFVMAWAKSYALVESSARPDDGLAAPVMTPWASVGGCGAGGGGGGGGGGAKWVGSAVTGGLINTEVMYTATIGQDYLYHSLNTRLSWKPFWRMTLDANLPWSWKIGEVQYTTVEDPFYAVTGGLGDVSADMVLTFGANGQYSATLALGFPTGQYDVKRGSDRDTRYLPTSLQDGSGLYSGTLTLSGSKDIQNGILLLDMSYYNPFALRFSGKNNYVSDYGNIDQNAAESNSRFSYYFKPYGENDLGDYKPQTVSATAFWGYRGARGYVHSFGVTFAAQLGVGCIHDPDPSIYKPVQDPSNQMWNGSLNYGLEFSRPKYPIFISIVKPIHDQSDPNGQYWRWDQPDWKDFMDSWSLAIGVRTTMF